MPALTGIRVVELGGGIPASLAARLLGDLGADVVKVESGAGDVVRSFGPMLPPACGAPRSALFEYLNWNKRSVRPNDEGPVTLRPSLLAADVIIDGSGSALLDVAAIAELRASAPQLVVVTVSPFGLDGPYAGLQASDLVLQALSGVMVHGTAPGRAPVRLGLRQASYLGGVHVAWRALVALYGARVTGVGAHVDVSLHEGLASLPKSAEPHADPAHAYGPEDLLACAQLAARDVWAVIPGDASVPSIRLPAVLARLSRSPTSVRRLAPCLGEHTGDVLTQVAGGGAAAHLPETPASLPGLRVLELATGGAVRSIGAVLAGLGAKVETIEPDQVKDGAFDALVGECDVLLEDLEPRERSRRWMTYGDLSAVNPRLLMVSITDWGSSGPWASLPGDAAALEVTMGLARYGAHPPADVLASQAGLVVLLGALVDQHRTGHGQWIDLGTYQLGAAMVPEALIASQVYGVDIAGASDADPDALFSTIVPAAGAERWLAVSATARGQLQRLAALVGVRLPDRADGPLPPAVDAALVASRRRWAADRDAACGARVLQDELQVAAGPVLDVSDVLARSASPTP